MSIGEVMNDDLFIARMNYTIGRVYSLKQDYDTSIYFHEKHLNLARQLHDSIGQCRAYYTLSQLNEKINQLDKAKKYDSLYRALSREVRRPLLSLFASHFSSDRRTDRRHHFDVDQIGTDAQLAQSQSHRRHATHQPMISSLESTY